MRVRRWVTAAVGTLSWGVSLSASAGVTLANVPVPDSKALRACGSSYSPPIAMSGPAVQPRQCPPVTPRTYAPKFQTIGHEVLRAESEACFVPDASFILLDQLIDQGRARYNAVAPQAGDWKESAPLFFTAMGDTLVSSGYQLYIPTETLGDALIPRPLEDGGKYIADCDTASLIYMSTAEVLGFPVRMVEITLSGGAGHNYLRWVDRSGEGMDWDTNGRERCVTPTALPAWQGKAMSREEVSGYTRGVRGLLYQKAQRNRAAMADYRESARLYPSSPFAHNNLAWLLATRAEFSSSADSREAVTSAQLAVSIEHSANLLDTLACAQARSGDFASARSTIKEVLTLSPANPEFAERQKLFEAAPPRNCVGLD